MATPEDALRSFIIGLSAFAAQTPVPAVRTDRAMQKDTLPFVIIGFDRETPYTSFEGTGGLVNSFARIRVCASSRESTRAIAEIIRTNNANPGTGLAGYTGTPLAGVTFAAAMHDHDEFDFVFFMDESDEGYYVQDCIYQIQRTETV